MKCSLPAAGALAVAVLTTTLSAQEPRPVTPPDLKDEAHKTVTLTGCLEASASLPGFRLTNVETDPSAAKSVPPAIGTSGKMLTYEVTARDGVNLSAHAGQKVTVTAIPDESVTAEPKPTPRESGDLKGPLPKLTIATVKTVAASCP